MISIAAIKRAWNRFFFEPTSPLPVCTYRIALGLTLLADAALIAPHVTALLGPDGVLSVRGSRQLVVGGGLDLLAMLPQANEMTIAFFALYVLAIVTLTLGLFTRVSAAVVYLGITSIHHRNPSMLNACDSFLRMMPFFLVFSPAGEMLSIDAWWRKRRGGTPRSAAVPWAQRMMQIQLCILYVVTVLLKLRGRAWVDGTAVYYVSRLDEFARFPLPYVTEHLWAIKAATWGTLVVELALGILVWVEECRRPVLIAGVLLHLGIEYSMNVPIMEWVNIGAFVLFLKPDEIGRMWAFIRPRRWIEKIRR